MVSPIKAPAIPIANPMPIPRKSAVVNKTPLLVASTINAICAATIQIEPNKTICRLVNFFKKNGATADKNTPGRLEQATKVPIRAIFPRTEFK